MLTVAVFCAAHGCWAHPMGNFSISHYAEITLQPGAAELRYIIDMAEIPTFQEMQQYAVTAASTDAERNRYLRKRAVELEGGLTLMVDGQSIPLDTESVQAIFPVGAGGLPTLKIGILYRAKLAQDCARRSCRLSYEDRNFAGRAGWKEIIIVPGSGFRMQSSTAPDHDRSARLTNYPTDLVNSPPQALSAQAVFLAAAPRASAEAPGSRAKAAPSPMSTKEGRKDASASGMQAVPRSSERAAGKDAFAIAANAQGTPRNAFTELIAAPKVSFGVAILAALIAAGLGALHALEPGHGKTIVAAYLVGAKGTARHALLLGTIVTATHTAGVYLLGAVTLYARKYILPDNLYPVLGVLSGVLIVGMGVYLLLQRLAGADVLHVHAGGEAVHRHFGLAHSHLPAGLPAAGGTSLDSGADNNPVRLRQLLVLGITGGIIPCPAALVVLLSALSLNRTVFGMLLIVAFSIGLAAVLIGMGMIAVYAGRWMSTMRVNSPLVQRWLPVTSASMITLLGCAIAVRSLLAAGILPHHL